MRPDWPVASLVTLLGRTELTNRPRRDVAVALTWVACESETKTPARILETGPWWRATNAEKAPEDQRRPPRREEECRTHPGEYAPPNCRACWSDKKAQRDEETAAAEQERHASAAAALAAARAEVRKHTHQEAPTEENR